MSTTRTPTTDRTPDRYRASTRRYERKSWLYERYWADVLTVEQIAARTDVSAQTIVRRMDELGIPRRPPKACHCECPEDVARVYRRKRATTTQGAESPKRADWSAFA